MRRRLVLELGLVVAIYYLVLGRGRGGSQHGLDEFQNAVERGRRDHIDREPPELLAAETASEPLADATGSQQAPAAEAVAATAVAAAAAAASVLPRTWPPAVPEATGCVSWRQTGGCVPTGPREPEHDLGCSRLVRGGTSGYCECEGGRRANEVGCFHKEFSCDRVCRGDREWQLPPLGQDPLTVADFERLASGARCHTAGNVGVLVAAPFARSMHVDLRRQLFANLLSLECANTGFNLYFALYLLRAYSQHRSYNIDKGNALRPLPPACVRSW